MDLKLLAIAAVLLALSGTGTGTKPDYPDTMPDLTCEFVQREQWHDLIQKVAAAASGKAHAYVLTSLNLTFKKLIDASLLAKIVPTLKLQPISSIAKLFCLLA